MAFATVTPSEKQIVNQVNRRKLTADNTPFVILGPPYDCSMITFRPEGAPISQMRKMRRDRSILHTFWTEGDADCICEDVDAFEDGSSAFVREFDFLVSTTGQ
jgi:hypothetical protein